MPNASINGTTRTPALRRFRSDRIILPLLPMLAGGIGFAMIMVATH